MNESAFENAELRHSITRQLQEDKMNVNLVAHRDEKQQKEQERRSERDRRNEEEKEIRTGKYDVEVRPATHRMYGFEGWYEILRLKEDEKSPLIKFHSVTEEVEQEVDRKKRKSLEEEDPQRHLKKGGKEVEKEKLPFLSGATEVETKHKKQKTNDEKERRGRKWAHLEVGVERDVGIPLRAQTLRKETEAQGESEETTQEERHKSEVDAENQLKDVFSDAASGGGGQEAYGHWNEEEEEEEQEEAAALSTTGQQQVFSFSGLPVATEDQKDAELQQKEGRARKPEKERKANVQFSNLTAGDSQARCIPCSPAVKPLRPLRSLQGVSVRALPEEEPVGVCLTTLTRRDILSSSVVEVLVAGLRGEHGSVTDPHLGPLQGGATIPCATCATLGCLGHSGHIDLRQHVFHPAFVMRCVQTLRKLCYHCLGPAKLCQQNLAKVRRAKAAQRRQPKLTEIWLDGGAAAAVEEEPNPRLCARKQPKYRAVEREGVQVVEVVEHEREQQREIELPANTVRAIFARVSQRTWRYLGLKDPSNKVFIRYLRVSPASCRPAALVNGHLVPSPITVRYNDVVMLRNELDRLNMRIKQLMNGQDEMVRGGVRVLIHRQIDALAFPGHQPAAAPTAILDDERVAARCAASVNEDNKEEDGANENDVASKNMNFISDDKEAGDADEDKKYLNGFDNGGKEETKHEPATQSTPPLAEWLLNPDDDEGEDAASGNKEQGVVAEDKDDKEETWECEELRRTDRLHSLKQQVEAVVIQVCLLRQQARKKSLALSAAVAAVIQEQVSKISGKKGIVRHHLLGKRINQCARAVFTGDNSLPLGVVGVPRSIATKLFQYVHVHDGNMKECEAMVERFPEYPSAVAVVRGNTRIQLQAVRSKMVECVGPMLRLQVGDVVQRHLTDGDQVVVNRQPTLARANMETHTVRVTDSRTISLNISITDNYAADCDGDEMNLFVPGVESHMSRLLNVSHNAVFPKSGKVSQRIKQDAMRGAYSASLRDTFLTLEEFTSLMPSDSEVPPPALLKPRRLWTGLQLLSLALPRTLTVEQAGVAMELDTLVVRHGTLLSGVFDKGAQDKILECCKMFFGRDAIMVTVQRLQGVAERFVDEVGGAGFTFLPEDWSCPTDTLDEMRQELRDALRLAQGIKCPVRRNAKLRQLLADQANKLVPQLARESNAAAMLKAGSKKRPQKLAQVCLAVGQHNQNDQLPARHLDGCRLLPFFSTDDMRPQAEGFIDEPLFGTGSITADVLSGMVARSSSYKKHCATGESGYLQRKLGKLMEDLTVRHDGTVRDANDEIVQLLYGDDGLMAECCVMVTLRTEPLPDHVAEFYLALISDRRLPREERRLLREELWALWSDRHQMRREAQGDQLEVSVPFHLPHLMAHVLATVPASGPPPCVTHIVGGRNKFFALLDNSIEKPLSEATRHRTEEYEVIVAIRHLQAAAARRIGRPQGPQPRQSQGGKLPKVNVRREVEMTAREAQRGAARQLLGDPLITLKRYVRQHVNTLSVRVAGFSEQQFSALLSTMTRLYQESRPAAGECVGALAAQSLAEPLMQMTLNACHRAAVASDGDAIPRLTELLNGQAEDAMLELRQGGLLRARDYLVREIGRVYGAAGEVVDVRHIRLVVDHMLKEGKMRGFTRHHVPPQVSFLKAAAFEQPLSILQRAGTQGLGDGLQGVSENLILNGAVDVGPDACDAFTWVGLRGDACLPTPAPPPSQPQPRQDAQHSEDELSDVSLLEDSGQTFLDSDNELTFDVPRPDDPRAACGRESPPLQGSC